ncbi:unnamed protein product [Soboliphyme baturini]|uniref:Lachesin n=1 Tax=Soboliphyme baturini TaxID=241478 RepID=A0A183J3G7_9BILA|nr:unnamed protein product [Soboliphyme baturini]
MKDIIAVRGSDVTFACQVINAGRHLVAFVRAEPTVLLTWQHRVFASRPHKYNLEVRGDTWLLEVRNVQPSDEGLYMCQVNTNPMMAQIAYLSLKVPPRIDKDRTTHDVIVQEGQNVTLNCAADGSPTPTISWRHKDGAVILTNSPEGYGESVVLKQNLTLYRVSRKHMGEYICLASNDVPPDESWSIRLHVHFSPSIRPIEAVVNSGAGKSAQLSCVAEAWPKPEFSWEFRGTVIVPDYQKYRISIEANQSEAYDTLSTLTIDHLSKTDAGTYFCAASNEYGSVSSAVELKGEKTKTIFLTSNQ